MDKKRAVRRYWGVFSTILVAIVFVFAVILVGMRLFGYQLYTVMSGSMEPTYHVGSLIYVKQMDPADIKENDVITFVADDNGTVVTHRVVSIMNEKGTLRFRTKGDANTVDDAQLVHEKNVLGEPRFQIPLLGYLAFYIQHPPGLYIAIVVGTLLLAAVISPIFSKGKEKTASKKKN